MVDKDEESRVLFGLPASELTPVQARDLEEHLAAKERLAHPWSVADSWWKNMFPKAKAGRSEGEA
jgi:hypothetical protein